MAQVEGLTLAQLLNYLAAGPMVTALILILVFGAKGKWRWGREVEDIIRSGEQLREELEARFELMKADRDQWRELCLHTMHLASRGVETADKMVTTQLRSHDREREGS